MLFGPDLFIGLSLLQYRPGCKQKLNEVAFESQIKHEAVRPWLFRLLQLVVLLVGDSWG